MYHWVKWTSVRRVESSLGESQLEVRKIYAKTGISPQYHACFRCDSSHEVCERTHFRTFASYGSHYNQAHYLLNSFTMTTPLFASRRKPRRVGREPETAASAGNDEEGTPLFVCSLRTLL
jgi:hypothetical protein